MLFFQVQHIEIRTALKRGVLRGKSLIFCAFASAVLAYTRVKSQVQILYRLPTVAKTPAEFRSPVIVQEGSADSSPEMSRKS
jgi:hypothetical protein